MKFAGFIGKTFVVYLAAGLGAGVGTAICGVATYKAIDFLNRKAEQKENEK